MSLLVRLKYSLMYSVCVCVSGSFLAFQPKRKWQRSYCEHQRSTATTQRTSASNVRRKKSSDKNEWHFFSVNHRDKCTSTDKQRNICGNSNRSSRLRLIFFEYVSSENVEINSITSEWWRIWCDNSVWRLPFPVPPRRRFSSIFSPDFWPLSQTIFLRSKILRFPFSMQAIASQPAA